MASNIINEYDKLIKYRYKVAEVFIITEDETINLPIERVNNFKIEHYFDDASFPLFRISLLLESSKYFKIVSNKKNIKFKLRIQKYYVEDKKENNSLLRDVINDTFSIFLEDNNSDYEKTLKREENKTKNSEDLHDVTNNVEFFLFKESYVTGLRSTINAVLENCTLTTAVAYLLYKANCQNVLMSPFDNKTVYESIVLPPTTIEKNLKFLNNNFGFHELGTVIYFGLFHGYIINYKDECTAWYNTEKKETVICIMDKASGSSDLSGAILKSNDNSKNYYNAVSNSLYISSPTMSTNVIQGTNAVSIDMQNANTTTSYSNANVIGKSNNTVLFNNVSNPYMGNVYAMQQYANSTVIYITIQNVDIEAFTPNKIFSIIFEDQDLSKKYKGIYKLSSITHTFVSSGSYYGIESTLTLKKVDKFENKSKG